jgi:hypothetical protein
MNKERSGFTRVELFGIVTVLVVIVALVRPFKNSDKPKAGRIMCVNNLKNIGPAFRIFATDHGDRFPPAILLSNKVDIASIDILSVYLALTNELSTPKILYCPEDKKRASIGSFFNLGTKNLSYFVSLSATENTPQALLAGDRNLQTNDVVVSPGMLLVTTNSNLSWSKEMHEGQGNSAMGDGSVQQFSSIRLKQGLINQQTETNYLIIP